MEWNNEQLEAIETTGKNILVSAAAGSGKTTVLVERVKSLVLNGETDIDRFLITTFTKAAASEMKERLEAAIRKEMKKPDADKAKLTRQLQQLPGASIGTFHSFAIEIIRQYFYLTDLEPGFSVADDIQMALMKRDALNKVFEKRYEENTEEFKSFILKYSSSRGDDRLKENILDTYKTLVSIPDYIGWADDQAEKLNVDNPMELLACYSTIAGMIGRRMRSALRCYERAASIAEMQSLESVSKETAADAEAIGEIAAKAPMTSGLTEAQIRESIESFIQNDFVYSLQRMTFAKDGTDDETKEAINSERKAGKKNLEAISDLCKRGFDAYEAELGGAYSDTAYYVGLINEFVNTFRGMKAAENVIDFDDIMHYALAVLSNEEAAGELREKYEFIFVDEYQDSNYLQEEIVRKIARDDNLFMVGDVKQCIYKFRLAEPEIFRDKAKEYDREDTEKSVLINLNSNYRSKSNVTEPVNDTFSRIMEGYDDNSKLNCSVPEEHPGIPARLHIINREDFDEDAPDKGDAEAAVVAGIIRERLGQEIYDTKSGESRALSLRDFAVITRNNRTVEEIERYLINEGIPAFGEGSGKYYETVEVKVFLNLLRIIDNMRQDVPLISAMKSVVFGFTVDELAMIRISDREGSFYDAVMGYPENGSEDAIKEKIGRMIDTVLLWKEISRTVPLEELMKVILYDTGYYDYCSGLPVGAQRVSNLRLIAEKASRFEEISHGGLYGFLRYIESMQDAGETDSEAKIIGENEDVVRVMNVHKSKGLEFPVVIFPNASKETRRGGSAYGITIHRDYGIGIGIVNREEHWHRKTILQKMIDDVKEREQIEEEIRILYVALTRAKDCLEIVGTVKDMKKIAGEASTDTFLDMIYAPFAERSEVETKIYENSEELEQAHEVRMHSAAELYAKAEEARSRTDEGNDRIVMDRLGFAYPYAGESTVKPKYSVSELNKRGKAQTLNVAEFRPDMEDKALTAADKGTIMHLLMEKTDFARAAKDGRDYIQSVADGLLACETLSAAEYDSLNIDKAAAFFSGEIGRRAAEASDSGKLQKEKEFILSMDMDGVSTVVQGIIDCYFEENGEIVLIDYKSNYVGSGRTKEDIAEAYMDQIALYRKALEGATGKKVREAYLFLFDIGSFIEM